MSEPERTAAALSYGVAKADLEIPTLTIAEQRAQYLALAQRHVRPGSGSSIAYLQRRTAIQSLFDLRQVIRNTRYLLVGGVATRHYMPERMTLATDILVLVGGSIAT